MATKYSKLPRNIPNCNKIYQIGTKYTNISHCKIYPNWDFWFENMPSGNPVKEVLHACFQGKKAKQTFVILLFDLDQNRQKDGKMN
jgi:hypothetical protein